MIILNLGCGTNFVKGAINVDLLPHDDDLPGGTLFVQADMFSYLEDCIPSSVDFAYLTYIIEHVSLEQAGYLTFLLNRALKVGGKICVTTANFNLLCHRYVRVIEECSILEQTAELMGLMYEIFNEEKSSWHKSIWSPELLKLYFMRDGFKYKSMVKHTGSRKIGMTVTFEKVEDVIWTPKF